MSKKNLKRGLALGALMAFVITGSAWAGAVYIDHEKFVDWGKSEEIHIFGEEGLQSDGNLNSAYVHYGPTEWESQYVPVKECNHENCDKFDYDNYNPDAPDTYVFNLNDKTLRVDGGIEVNGNDKFKIIGDGSTLELNGGLSIGGTVDIDTLNIKNGNLYTYGTEMEVRTKSLTINNPNGAGINVQGDSSTVGGGITINTEYLSVTSDDRALRTAHEGNLDITTNEIYITSGEESKATHKTNIVLSANKGTIDSNFIAGENGSKGTVNLTLGSGVTLEGSVVTDTVGTGENASASNITLNGATWNVTGDSNITTLAGNGTVTVGEGTTVTAGTVSSTTTITANEEYTKKLVDDGVISEEEMKTLGAQLAGATALVAETDLTGETTLTSDGKYTSNANTSNLGIRDMAGLALVAWRAENNDMNKRLGELRNANGEHGVWVRMVRGESEYSTVKNQYNTYQLGYDEKLSTDKSWTVGMALSYTDGESSFAKGSGENTSKAVAFYGSKLNKDGSFVDLVAKYARIENEYDITGGVGSAEYDANGYSVSAEYGKRFEQGNGLWIEPQVELTYGKVGSADYVTKKGYKVAQDSMESLVGRVGFSLGKDVKGGNVYARASYLYDFDGETELTFEDKVKMDQDLGGGWWEVGVGANINLSKATYIYADIEKTFGGEVDTNWQWNLGVRYSF